MPLLLLFRPKRHIMCRFGRLLRSYRGKLTLPLHVGASFISLALIFYTKNQSLLMPLLLLFRPKRHITCRFERVCAFGTLRLLLLLLQKGTLGSSVRLQAYSLTAHCRCRLFASMSGCKFFYSSSHFVSLRKKSAAHLIGETRGFFNLDFVAVF